MNFTRLAIPDVILCEPKLICDERGYFSETFRKDQLEDFIGHQINFCQDNESKSSYGVLRGLHWQLPPHAQTKLIRVIEGSVLDVAVDIRKGSPTFGDHVFAELTSENNNQLFIPRGFAHGFVVLSKEAVFAYKVDNYYSPECERGLVFDDKLINIDWQVPENEMRLSEKDKNQVHFDKADFFSFKENLYL